MFHQQMEMVTDKPKALQPEGKNDRHAQAKKLTSSTVRREV